MKDERATEQIREKFNSLRTGMSEAVRRRWAATEARALGRGGISWVARATGLSIPTIRRGLSELEQDAPLHTHRSRKSGGGRKKVATKDETILIDLESLVEPLARGDPMSPLRWTCKSTRKLAQELNNRGHIVSYHTAGELLHALGYSLQSNRKTQEGGKHPDRNAQFEHTNMRVKDFQKRKQPVISVDAKKKELVGNFKNAGREWYPTGRPHHVRVYDFVDSELGKILPYGVYDLSTNEGWVSVGVTHDTPAFAVASIRMWWLEMGRMHYPQAKELLIVADGGGSNGTRVRSWKVELQRLADEVGLSISVSHLPPGTSKWNKIEHRMFCHITRNWRGRPLESREIAVNLIGSTTTNKGLHIQAALDLADYPTGLKVSNETMSSLRIERDTFHGEWNYSIIPNVSDKSHQ